MREVFLEAVAFCNLPFTVLLGLVVVYWLLVALGALDTDFGADAELDASVDADVDADGHHARHMHADAEAGWFSNVLHFINVGDVPLMVVLSVMALCLWLGSMIANHYWTGGNTLLALAALVPNSVLSLVVTRYVTLPLKPLFRLLRRDEDEHVPVVGRQCRITTSEANGSFGQAEIATEGAPLLIDVRTLDGGSITRGTTAVVVRADNDRGIYFIAEMPRPQLS